MPNQRVDWVAGRTLSRLVLVALASSLAGCVTSNTNVATATRATGESRVSLVRVARAPASHHAPAPHSTSKSFDGIASYYWEGTHVASGARFEPNGLTAAHRTLPLGTKLRVSDPKTKRSVIVTVNDRGPFVKGRDLDLSLGAARALGMEHRGVSRVRADVL